MHRISLWSAVDLIVAVNYNLCNCNNSRRWLLSSEKAVFNINYRAIIYSWTRISIISCHCINRLKKGRAIILLPINWVTKTRHRQVLRRSEFLRKTRIFNKMIVMSLPPELLFVNITSKLRPNKFIFLLFRRPNNIMLVFIRTKVKCTKQLMVSNRHQRNRPT